MNLFIIELFGSKILPSQLLVVLKRPGQNNKQVIRLWTLNGALKRTLMNQVAFHSKEGSAFSVEVDTCYIQHGAMIQNKKCLYIAISTTREKRLSWLEASQTKNSLDCREQDSGFTLKSRHQSCAGLQ